MKIKYFGHSCFKLTESTGFSVLTDPFGGIGYELPKTINSDVVTVSHDHFDHNNVGAVSGNPTVLRKDGFFDFGDVEITGVKSYHDEEGGALRGENVIYKYRMDGLDICHLGDLGTTPLISVPLTRIITLLPILRVMT